MAVTSNTQSGENIVAFTWTVESLKEHFSTVMAGNDRRYEERFIAQEKATDVALEALNKRFDSVNEFRQTLADQTATFIPRIEAIQRADNNADKITALEKRLNESVSSINSRLDLNAGKSTGMNAIWGYLVGAIGLSATIISIILVFNN